MASQCVKIAALWFSCRTFSCRDKAWVVFKSVQVGVVGTVSVRRPNAPVVFSHPVAHCTIQDIMEGIFLCLGCRSPNVAVSTNSLRLVTVRFLCQSPQRTPIFAFRMCNFPGTCFRCFSPFLECDSPVLLAHCHGCHLFSPRLIRQLPLDPPCDRQSLGVAIRAQMPELAHGR